jgi:hypothetical protein
VELVRWIGRLSLRDRAQQRRDARLLLAEVSAEGYSTMDDRYAVRKDEEA